MLQRSELQAQQGEITMTPNLLIWKELWQRPTALVNCLLAISLGISALVAIRSITLYSEQAVSEQLSALGANVLLLPPGVSLEGYYAADAHGATLPESHVSQLILANLEGVEHVSAKLSVPAEFAKVEGGRVTLTGILPQDELQTLASFQSVQAFSNAHAGCKGRAKIGGDDQSAAESLANSRYIHKLAVNEVVIGADVAASAGLKEGDSLTLLGYPFKVCGVMSATGTVDDGRVFAHLHTVQRLAKKGEEVNVIEIMACCEDAAGGLISQLGEQFPDAKVVTITQVVDTQVAINRLMTQLSYLFFGILLIVGMASIAGTMFANVSERRKEIGTLMALGAAPKLVARLFLGKALVIGLAGGALGYLIGTGLAIGLGPMLSGIEVQPVPTLGVLAVVVAAVIALVASYPPARRASLVDPCICFREV
jgi:putative ABC transport system permease protein